MTHSKYPDCVEARGSKAESTLEGCSIGVVRLVMLRGSLEERQG